MSPQIGPHKRAYIENCSFSMKTHDFGGNVSSANPTRPYVCASHASNYQPLPPPQKNLLLTHPSLLPFLLKNMYDFHVLGVLRGLTGTVRIVPFMLMFYGFLGTGLPLFTDMLMTKDKNKDYATASDNTVT